MGTAKEKKTVWDVPYTETDDGLCAWMAGGHVWRHRKGRNTVNTWFVLENGDVQPVAFFRTLREAVLFAQGWASGCHYGYRQAKEGRVEAT